MAWSPPRNENGIALPKWTDADAMQAAVDAYFTTCAEAEKPATVTGLALALGFTDRHSLIRYAAGEVGVEALPEDVRRAMSHTVKRAKAYIEDQAETRLYQGKVNPIGTIFSLKNNFGWIDRVEHEGGNNFTVQIVSFQPEQLASNVMDQRTIDVQPVAQTLPNVAQQVEIEANPVALDGSTNGEPR